VCLDGTLIHTDRVGARSEAGHHLWYSGKHKTQGANVQIVADPTGFPVWSAPAEPGSVHDLTAAPTGLPTLADKGYDGTHAGIHTPVKGRNLAEPNTSYNTLRALGERANAELTQRWRCLRRIRLCAHRIGDIVVDAIVLSTLQTRKLLRTPQYRA